jgi:hypothetical protein
MSYRSHEVELCRKQIMMESFNGSFAINRKNLGLPIWLPQLVIYYACLVGNQISHSYSELSRLILYSAMIIAIAACPVWFFDMFCW